jgi:hypothetical protein
VQVYRIGAPRGRRREQFLQDSYAARSSRRPRRLIRMEP